MHKIILILMLFSFSSCSSIQDETFSNNEFNNKLNNLQIQLNNINNKLNTIEKQYKIKITDESIFKKIGDLENHYQDLKIIYEKLQIQIKALDCQINTIQSQTCVIDTGAKN